MATEAQIIERPKMKRQPRKRLIRARAYSLIKAVGLSSVVLAKRSGYSHRQTLYALDGRRTCPERVAEVLRAMIGPDGWRYLCGEADSVTLTRTFEETSSPTGGKFEFLPDLQTAGQRTVYSAHAECTDAQTPSMAD